MTFKSMRLAIPFKAIVIFLPLLIASLMVLVVVRGDIVVDRNVDVQFGGTNRTPAHDRL